VLLAIAGGFIMQRRVPVLTVKSACRSVRRLQSLFDPAVQERQTAAGENRTPQDWSCATFEDIATI